MPAPNGNVKFHVGGYAYYWHIPSGSVKNSEGELIANDCPNLATARRRVENMSYSRKENH